LKENRENIIFEKSFAKGWGGIFEQTEEKGEESYIKRYFLSPFCISGSEKRSKK
jgi:hypothetical protein